MNFSGFAKSIRVRLTSWASPRGAANFHSDRILAVIYQIDQTSKLRIGRTTAADPTQSLIYTVF